MSITHYRTTIWLKNMFKAKWDLETNGILLVSENEDIYGAVRPVFYEELDLLGFNDLGYSYPRIEEPILWAIGRFYYYRGEKIAKVEKGGYFEDVNIKLYRENVKFEPVNVEKMIVKNKDKIYFYSHDSIDFIRKCFDKYKSSADIALVSFSGGKDSVVVADLAKRSLNSDDFSLIFADTWLESKFTYDSTEEFIKENSNLNFIYTKYDEDPIEMWEKMGSPSRIHRWCHTVYKIAPIRKKIKEFLNIDTPGILLFDGIRSEESNRRSKYDSVQSGTKGMLQINVSPILNWTAYEVFLYMFNRKLKINKMYRYGFTRVGCIVCPYSSKWAEYLSSKLFPDKIEPYKSYLKEYATGAGIKDVEKYITDGGWKSRSGGLYLENGGNKVNFSINGEDFEIITSTTNDDFWQWISTIGKVVKNRTGGELLFESNIININETKLKNGFKYKIEDIGKEYILINLLKKISYKSSYCIRCGACESVCPTGALKIIGGFKVQSDKCINCKSCLNYVEKGCWVAKSISYVGVGSVRNMENTGNIKGMSRYQTFGLRTEWLSLFFKGEDWLNEGGELGNLQIESMKNWLKDAGFWDKKPKEVGELFAKLNNSSDVFMWSVIWNNLAENAPLINWYVLNIKAGIYSKADLVEAISKFRVAEISNRTDQNAISSLIQLFNKSLIGDELGQGTEIKNGNIKTYERSSPKNIPDIAILYSAYRYSEMKGRKGLVLDEMVRNKEVSPYTLFSLDANELKSSFLNISAKYPELIEVEFSGNLDNIKLKEEFSSYDVIKYYLKNEHGIL